VSRKTNYRRNENKWGELKNERERYDYLKICVNDLTAGTSNSVSLNPHLKFTSMNSPLTKLFNYAHTKNIAQQSTVKNWQLKFPYLIEFEHNSMH
jgi:hypothetical protein